MHEKLTNWKLFSTSPRGKPSTTWPESFYAEKEGHMALKACHWSPTSLQHSPGHAAGHPKIFRFRWNHASNHQSTTHRLHLHVDGWHHRLQTHGAQLIRQVILHVQSRIAFLPTRTLDAIQCCFLDCPCVIAGGPGRAFSFRHHCLRALPSNDNNEGVPGSATFSNRPLPTQNPTTRSKEPNGNSSLLHLNCAPTNHNNSQILLPRSGPLSKQRR